MTTRYAVISFAACVAAALALGAGYARVVPFGEKPDEPSHMARILYEARFDRAPGVTSPSVFPGIVMYEAVQPPAYYWLAARLLRRLPGVSWTVSPERYHGCVERSRRFVLGGAADVPPQAYWLRGLGLACVVVSGVLVFLSARTLEATSTQAVLAAALSLLPPQLLFIGSSVSNDGAATLVGSLLMFLALRATRGSAAFAFMTGIALPVAGVVKLNLLPYAVGVPLMMWALGPRRPGRVWTFLVLGAVTALLPAAGALSTPQGIDQRGMLERSNLHVAGLTPKDYVALIPDLVMSYWARFGWMDLEARASVRVAWIVMLALASVGWVRGSRIGPRRWPLWILFLTALAGWMLTLGSSNQTQGRFLFPFAGVVALLLAGGLGALRIPGLPAAVVALTLVSNGVCLLQLDAEYAPPPWPADLIIDAHQCYDDRVVLETLSSGERIGQSFYCSRSGLRAIDVVFCGSVSASNEVLFSLEDNATGHVFREESLPAPLLAPGHYTRIRFAPVRKSGHRMLRFTLKLAGADSGGTFSVRYSLGDPYLDGERYVGGSARDGDLRFVAWADTAQEARE